MRPLRTREDLKGVADVKKTWARKTRESSERRVNGVLRKEDNAAELSHVSCHVEIHASLSSGVGCEM